jgi:hypothetical protein
MRLDGLHHIREEPFALGDQPVFPHLVRDQTDKVCREENFLHRGWVSQAWSRNLETSDETVEDILVQTSDVLHESDLLFGRIIHDIR